MKIINTTISELIKILQVIPQSDKRYTVEITPVETTTETLSSSPSSVRIEIDSKEQKLITDTIISALSSQDIKIENVEPVSVPVPKEIPIEFHTSIKTQFYDVTKQVLEILSTRQVENAWINCDMQDVSSEYGKLASVTQTDGDQLKIIVNTGTIKFNSIKGNQFLLALHIAECIFREVLYHSTGEVDVQQLDTLIDQFYDQYFISLETKLNTDHG
jgi:citrate lyase gamma subunit